MLKKDISRLGLLFAAVGGVIGSGWLLGPFYTAQVAGPAAVCSWVIGGVLMMFIACTFAELSSSFPVAGGMVRFTHFSHGAFCSFTPGWAAWLAAVMVAPIETMAAVQYASNYIPGIAVSIAGKANLTAMGIGLAAVVMLIMCIINSYAVKYFAKSNSVIVSWKLTIPTIVVITLLATHFSSSNFTAFGGFAPAGLKGILTALPTAGVIFSFIGYSPAVQLAEEAKNPQRAIPFAIIGAISIAIVLYALIEIAFIGAIDPTSLLGGWSMLSFSGDAGPIAGLLAGLGIVWLLKIIYIDAVVQPMGTGYIYTAATARSNLAMSKNGYMPEFMQKLNRHGSPVYAIATNYVIGMLFFLPFPGWQSMVSFIVSCFVIAYAIGPIACATLRRIKPDIHRPFKVPCYWFFCALAFYISNLIVFWTGWHVVWKMLLTVLFGYGVLFVQRFLHKETKSLELRRGGWIVVYLLGIGILSYLGSFGGGANIMTFGEDFIVIGIFSIIVFAYAVFAGVRYHDPALDHDDVTAMEVGR